LTSPGPGNSLALVECNGSHGEGAFVSGRVVSDCSPVKCPLAPWVALVAALPAAAQVMIRCLDRRPDLLRKLPAADSMAQGTGHQP
jgi:hypothetical protein